MIHPGGLSKLISPGSGQEKLNYVLAQENRPAILLEIYSPTCPALDCVGYAAASISRLTSPLDCTLSQALLCGAILD